MSVCKFLQYLQAYVDWPVQTVLQGILIKAQLLNWRSCEFRTVCSKQLVMSFYNFFVLSPIALTPSKLERYILRARFFWVRFRFNQQSDAGIEPGTAGWELRSANASSVLRRPPVMSFYVLLDLMVRRDHFSIGLIVIGINRSQLNCSINSVSVSFIDWADHHYRLIQPLSALVKMIWRFFIIWKKSFVLWSDMLRVIQIIFYVAL